MDESNQITHATVNADPWIFLSEYLAGFLGFWTRGTKTFEVVYLFLWYLGPFYKTGYLDFTGAAPEIVMHQFLGIYLLLSLMMILSTLVGKRRTHL